MTQLKQHTRLTTLIITLLITNTVLAAGPITDENKNNSTGDPISDVNNPGHTDGGTSFFVVRNLNSSLCNQQCSIEHAIEFQKKQHSRQLWQQSRPDDYNRFLDVRKQSVDTQSHIYAIDYLPDIDAGYQTSIQIMEECRGFIQKVANEHRKAAEERSETMQL